MDFLIRAKRIDNDNYITSKSIQWIEDNAYLLSDSYAWIEIDSTTRAIGRKHIEDKTQTIIYFALNNEKGGDIVEFEGCKGVAKVGRYDFFINPLSIYNPKFYKNDGSMRFDYDDLKIIGIQQ